jgi:DNA-directed RNA polymerase specialized sigma24 family protein
MLTRTHEDAAMKTPDTPASIEQVYTDYYQPIRRYLERLVSNCEAAEDLAQETFIIYQGAAALGATGAGRERTWLALPHRHQHRLRLSAEKAPS